jgi:hypothetical protein
MSSPRASPHQLAAGIVATHALARASLFEGTFNSTVRYLIIIELIRLSAIFNFS